MAVASDLPALENQRRVHARARTRCCYAADGLQDRTPTTAPGRADRQPEPHPARRRARSRPTSRTRSSRSRTGASTSTRAWTTRASPARSGRTSCRQRAAQGGSTITQQFVKNALSAQGNRSVFQKLREAALAYHLERKWSKQKVLTQYLNTVYFGNGAYGVESAVRTYFGDADAPAGRHDRRGLQRRRPRGRRTRRPAEAALLAGDDRLAHRSTTRSRTRASAKRAARPRARPHARAAA